MRGEMTIRASAALNAVSHRLWNLSVAEDPSFAKTQSGQALAGVSVTAQFPQQDLERAFPIEPVVTGGFGAEKGTAPGARGPRTITFTSAFNARDNLDFGLEQIEQNLIRFTEKVPELGRPPLLLFQWSHIAEKVWLTGCSPKWEGGTHITGAKRRLSVTLTLTVAVERPIDETRQGDKPSTFYHVLRAGETAEHLALWYLGDPGRGPLIRRDPANVGLPWEPGDRVRILPRHNPDMMGEVKPAAPCFGDGWETVLDRIAAERVGD